MTQKNLVALLLILPFFLTACGEEGGPTQTPSFSPPLGEPSPIVRGTFDRQSASTTCRTDGSQLQIAQNVQEIWMKGGFDYGQPSREAGWEFSGRVDSENAVRFTIEGEAETLSCLAALLEPIFQGMCESTAGEGDFFIHETCDLVFSRATEGSVGGDPGDDKDGDGIPDSKDPCPTIKNAGMIDDELEDINQDGIVDRCSDQDGDKIADGIDNCPFDANPGQEDANSNGVGDVCGEDDNDDDGVKNDQDFCPYDCLICPGDCLIHDPLPVGDQCPSVSGVYDPGPGGTVPIVPDHDDNKIGDERRANVSGCPIP